VLKWDTAELMHSYSIGYAEHWCGYRKDRHSVTVLWNEGNRERERGAIANRKCRYHNRKKSENKHTDVAIRAYRNVIQKEAEKKI